MTTISYKLLLCRAGAPAVKHLLEYLMIQRVNQKNDKLMLIDFSDLITKRVKHKVRDS